MHNPEKFKTYLGKEKYYHDFLEYYQGEISKKGWEAVLADEVFKGDERADDMLARMFAGFLHPIIHLGFGIEFQQPAIIAEALAQAAVHDNWMATFFVEAEKAAKTNGADPQNTKPIVQLLDEIRADQKLTASAHWKDGNKIRDGIMKRAPNEMLKYASQYVISEDQLEEKTAEHINAAGKFSLYKPSFHSRDEHICSRGAHRIFTQKLTFFATKSVLHIRSPTPTAHPQIRLLLHALRQLRHLLLDLLVPPVARAGDQSPPPRVESAQ